MARRSSSEALAWGLFSAGGMVSALLVPVLLLLFGVVYPLVLVEPPEYSYLLAVVSNPLTRLALLVLCVLSLLHWAHRFRHALNILLRLKRLSVPIGLLCYGAAMAGSVWAAFVLFQ
jgi:fumarate reductase subunit D